MTKQRIPAVEGWFTTDGEPALLGERGVETGSYFFPATVATSANPEAPGEQRESVRLSRRGTVWSFATNHYAPPEPYVAPEPFVPYTVVAVELAEERMVVLGQLTEGVDAATLKIGEEVELELGTLFDDGENEYLIWKWRPVTDAGSASDE